MTVNPPAAQVLAPHLPVAQARRPEPAVCNDCSGSSDGRFDGQTCRAYKDMSEVMT